MKSLLALCQFLALTPPTSCDLELKHLSIDSRSIQKHDVFCAYQGDTVDGHHYVQAAIDQGAGLILAEHIPSRTYSVPVLCVPDLYKRLGEIAAWFYDDPSQKLKVIGVTGTNGKTSTSHYLTQLLHFLGHKVAVIGTIGNGFFGKLSSASHTTPDAASLQRLLAYFHQQGAEYIVMEVSSHALMQHRVSSIAFISAVFTNLSQDHLDYHGNMSDYAAAKAKLFAFPSLKNVILNQDDPASLLMLKQVPLKTKIMYYSTKSDDDTVVHALNIKLATQGMYFDLRTPLGFAKIHSHLLGTFNASNILAALSTLLALGFPLAKIVALTALLTPVQGRMEVLRYPDFPLVVIDYAHTPDALEKALLALKVYQKPLWLVFGCGGDRDRGKRALMAKVAEHYADTIIVTEDNSRMEAAQQIFADIFSGFELTEVITLIPKREDAITYAIKNAPNTAIILLAGKGHETYLDTQGVKTHFDERELVKALTHIL